MKNTRLCIQYSYFPLGIFQCLSSLSPSRSLCTYVMNVKIVSSSHFKINAKFVRYDEHDTVYIEKSNFNIKSWHKIQHDWSCEQPLLNGFVAFFFHIDYKYAIVVLCFATWKYFIFRYKDYDAISTVHQTHISNIIKAFLCTYVLLEAFCHIFLFHLIASSSMIFIFCQLFFEGCECLKQRSQQNAQILSKAILSLDYEN